MSRASQADRAWWLARLPLPCSRCGQPVTGHVPWDVGHVVPRKLRPDLERDRRNQWPEHRACNRAAGARIVMQTAPVARRPL